MARRQLGFMQLTILVSYSLYYAGYLIVFFGLFMHMPAEWDFAPFHAGQALFFLGSVMTTLFITALFHRGGNGMGARKPGLRITALALGLLLPGVFILESLGVQVPLAVFYLACVLSGASIGFGFMFWEQVSEGGYLNRGVLAHGTTFCAGGIIFLASSFFLTVLQMCVLAIILFAASAALLMFITPRCDLPDDKPVDAARSHFKGAWHLDIVIGVITLAFGFAFIVFYDRDPFALLVAMGVAVFADLAFSIAFGRGKWVLFSGWARIVTAVASCALLAFVCPSDIAKSGALGVLVVLWFVFRTMNGGSLADLANHRGYPILYMSTRGNLSANAGFALGLALGTAAVSAPMATVSQFYIPLALVAAFIVASLLFMPLDYGAETAGYKTLAIVDMHESPEQDLNRMCEETVRRFKLSPRESEVLTYLVRGRNAKHISEKLYISESTVKTHISNIYRKLGVHSQQELLDALEELNR